MSGLTSSGRGGAGNYVDKANSPALGPKDLETPTLKTSVVTTGRGGTGNMARNTDPAETRARQDVEPVTRKEGNAHLVGRGGGGNLVRPRPEDEETGGGAGAGLARVVTAEPQQGERLAKVKTAEDKLTRVKTSDRVEGEGLVEKGRQWLFGKK